MPHAGKSKAHGKEPPAHHTYPANDEVLEVNAHNRRVQLFPPVHAKRKVVVGTVVGCGGRVEAFEEEQEGEDEGGGIEQRHNLHEVVVYELCWKNVGVMTQREDRTGDHEGGNTVAFEL